MEMSHLIPFVATIFGAGIAGGILAGLLGVGGGIVIVPALYFALSSMGMPSGLTMQVAVGTSLTSIIFTAASSASGHWRRGSIDVDLLKLWAPSILVGVIIGGAVGGLVNGKILIGVFASVAGLVDIDMVFRKGKDGVEQRNFSKPVWAFLGVIAGGISAMMGIGGGTVCVPILNFLGYDIRKAVGTSSAIGFVIGVPGAITYVITGIGKAGLPPFSFGYVNYLAVILLIPLTMTFARVGVRIAHTIPQRALSLLFGLFLAITSINMFRDLF